jgi:hypothetical protein
VAKTREIWVFFRIFLEKGHSQSLDFDHLASSGQSIEGSVGDVTLLATHQKQGGTVKSDPH